jgi:hypothetical protein
MRDTLDTIQTKVKTNTLERTDLEILLSPSFQDFMFHPAREQTLLSTLNMLFHHKDLGYPFLQDVMPSLQKNKLLGIFLKRNIAVHKPGGRCKFYQRFMDDYSSNIECWSCISYILRTNNKEEVLNKISINIFKIDISMYTSYHESVFIEILETLERRNTTLFKCMYEWIYNLLRSQSSEDAAVRFMCSVFSSPSLMYRYFVDKDIQKDIVKDAVYKKIIERIRFKEELLHVAWHPDRFFEFCLDDEEKEGLNARWNWKQPQLVHV